MRPTLFLISVRGDRLRCAGREPRFLPLVGAERSGALCRPARHPPTATMTAMPPRSRWRRLYVSGTRRTQRCPNRLARAGALRVGQVVTGTAPSGRRRGEPPGEPVERPDRPMGSVHVVADGCADGLEGRCAGHRRCQWLRGGAARRHRSRHEDHESAPPSVGLRRRARGPLAPKPHPRLASACDLIPRARADRSWGRSMGSRC